MRGGIAAMTEEETCDHLPNARQKISDFLTRPATDFGKPVCRLGLASRGDGALTSDDVLDAVSRGVNFFNWPGLAEGPDADDAMSEAVRHLGSRREAIVVCIQFGARTSKEGAQEFRSALAALRTDYIDVVTLYYVERRDEFREICGSGGAMEFLQKAKADGMVRRIGVTSHQRPLAAEMARSGIIDLLMIRYNAAHRGAEREVFPVTDALRMPIIAYTAQRWGALSRPTSLDPSGFAVPRPPDWYRFALQSPSVSVVLAAPANRAELDEDLQVLKVAAPLPQDEFDKLAAHGERVRQSAGRFP